MTIYPEERKKSKKIQILRLINGDIRDYDKLYKSLNTVDAVIHLAYVNGTKFLFKTYCYFRHSC